MIHKSGFDENFNECSYTYRIHKGHEALCVSCSTNQNHSAVGEEDWINDMDSSSSTYINSQESISWWRRPLSFGIDIKLHSHKHIYGEVSSKAMICVMEEGRIKCTFSDYNYVKMLKCLWRILCGGVDADRVGV